MIDGLVAGRMYGTAMRRQRQSSSYVLCKVRAEMNGGDALIVNVITFNDAAGDALLSLADGESVALAGELKPRIGVSKKALKPALDMVARAVLTTARRAPIDGGKR